MENSWTATLLEGASMGRRALLRMATGATGAAALRPIWSRACRADDGGPGLIVRNERPLDLESPVSALDRWLTPNDMFFVRSHLSVPAVDLAPWRLEIGGMVEHGRALTLDDLDGLETVTVPAVLQCSGNGRLNFKPTIPGVGWDRGAVGHAEWSGVRLADLLGRAGVRDGAAHVHTLGADVPPSTKTPIYLRSIPLAKALDPSTIVATRMNGEPLPMLHGGPLRLVVPGWTGNNWMKWLRRITVARDEAPGFYMQAGYRIAKVPAPPGADLKPADLVPLTAMNVKSLITHPLAGAILKPGRHEVRGVAWTGTGHVNKVEFAAGEGDNRISWTSATLQGDPRPGSWRIWRGTWNVTKPGRLTFHARATDSNGEVQPESTPWNRSGYLWNAIDRVTCEVRRDA